MKEFKFIREYVTECAIEETIVVQAKTKEEALEKIRNKIRNSEEIPNMNEDPELYIDFIRIKSLCDDPTNTETLNIREIKENKK